MSIYRLKPRFQDALRPSVAWLYRHRVTANQVTVTAGVISVVIGAWLCQPGTSSVWFAAIPVWMFLRMALNAVDGQWLRDLATHCKVHSEAC